MTQGKRGTIDVTVGKPERIHKDKSGHLLIVNTRNHRFFCSSLYLLIFKSVAGCFAVETINLL